MSIDKSLKMKGALVRHRNVLTRAERIEKLSEEGRWDESQSTLGLPKVVHRKSSAGAKKKAEAAAKTQTAEGAEATEAAKPAEGEKK